MLSYSVEKKSKGYKNYHVSVTVKIRLIISFLVPKADIEIVQIDLLGLAMGFFSFIFYLQICFSLSTFPYTNWQALILTLVYRPFSQLALSCQTAICAEIETQYVVNLVQVLGECYPNAPKKYWDQVYNTLGLDFGADPGIHYKHEKGLQTL